MSILRKLSLSNSKRKQSKGATSDDGSISPVSNGNSMGGPLHKSPVSETIHESQDDGIPKMFQDVAAQVSASSVVFYLPLTLRR